MKRCSWPGNDSLMISYHDKEWGVPVHDDRLLFEYIILDAFQAGLSWRTVLNKRKNFRKAFDNFDSRKIAKYGKKKYQSLLSDSGIIRNRAKINAAITNAQRFLEIQKTGKRIISRDLGHYERQGISARSEIRKDRCCEVC